MPGAVSGFQVSVTPVWAREIERRQPKIKTPIQPVQARQGPGVIMTLSRLTGAKGFYFLADRLSDRCQLSSASRVGRILTLTLLKVQIKRRHFFCHKPSLYFFSGSLTPHIPFAIHRRSSLSAEWRAKARQRGKTFCRITLPARGSGARASGVSNGSSPTANLAGLR